MFSEKVAVADNGISRTLVLKYRAWFDRRPMVVVGFGSLAGVVTDKL